jgi:hypothetical protein
MSAAVLATRNTGLSVRLLRNFLDQAQKPITQVIVRQVAPHGKLLGSQTWSPGGRGLSELTAEICAYVFAQGEQREITVVLILGHADSSLRA